MSSSNYDGASTELVPGTLRGYRAWGLPSTFSFSRSEPLAPLKSASMDFFWLPGPPVRARCLSAFPGFLPDELGLIRKQHPSPVKGCTCGYYATYKLESLPFFQSGHLGLPG